MISGAYRKLIFCVTLAVLGLATHAFEDAFFAKNGKFKCLSAENCHLPTYDEIEWIKNEFKSKSLKRLVYLNKYEERVSSAIETVLYKAQMSEIKTNDVNNFSTFYNNTGSFLVKKFSEMKIETAKVILSEGSPFIMELEDLVIME